MRIVPVFAILIFVVGMFAFACSSDSAETKTDSAEVCKPKPLNPNGDVELAILMREMANWTDSCKAAIQSGRSMPAKPEKLNTLQTAERTDKNLDESIYLSMAHKYETEVSAFESATEADRKDRYNAMVQACVDCHKNFCQGPLVRINKMFIQ